MTNWQIFLKSVSFGTQFFSSGQQNYSMQNNFRSELLHYYNNKMVLFKKIINDQIKSIYRPFFEKHCSMVIGYLSCLWSN